VTHEPRDTTGHGVDTPRPPVVARRARPVAPGGGEGRGELYGKIENDEQEHGCRGFGGQVLQTSKEATHSARAATEVKTAAVLFEASRAQRLLALITLLGDVALLAEELGDIAALLAV
jgi:hypothetical protein